MTAHDHYRDDFEDRELHYRQYPRHRQAHDEPDAPDVLYYELDAPETSTTLLTDAVLLVAVLIVVAAAGGIL